MNTLFSREERKVEYVELIYDLIFVYLVSRNGSLLHVLDGGFVEPAAFLTYLASTMAVLQIWYLSSLYINRFGTGSLREHLMLFVNMYLLYYMADGIQPDWGETYFRYNGAWTLILLNMALQYALTARHFPEGEVCRRYCMRHVWSLLIEACIVALSMPVYRQTGYALAPWALAVGVALPLMTRQEENDLEVDFPHLAERVMLYIVFTFGEMILGIVGYFDDGLTFRSAYFSFMAFAIVVGLFSGYGHYYNKLMDPASKTSGAGYMLLHIVMILALNNVTAGMEFLREPGVAAVQKTVFMTVSMLVYYLCILGTQRYARFRVDRKGRFYTLFILGLVLYCAAMALCCYRPVISITVTTAFIYVQLWSLHYGAKQSMESFGERKEAQCR